MKNNETSPVLEVVGVSKRIKKKQILDQINLKVFPGEAVGLVGPNGSGKSSLMKCITTAYKQDSGFINISGFEAVKEHAKAMKNIGICIENPALYSNLSGLEHLKLYAGYKQVPLDDPHTQQIMEYCALGPAWKKRAGTYSIGMKQRLSIGIALLGNPPLLLLDEPTNGLDPESTFKLRKLLEKKKAQGTSMLVTSHILGDLEKICDRFLFIKQGKIIRSVSQAEIKDHFHNYAFEVDDAEKTRKILQPYLHKNAGTYFEACFPDGETFETALKQLAAQVRIRDVYRIESDLEALYKKIYGTAL